MEKMQSFGEKTEEPADEIGHHIVNTIKDQGFMKFEASFRGESIVQEIEQIYVDDQGYIMISFYVDNQKSDKREIQVDVSNNSFAVKNNPDSVFLRKHIESFVSYTDVDQATEQIKFFK